MKSSSYCVPLQKEMARNPYRVQVSSSAFTLGIVIGDRDGSRRSRWNGLIDNVRVSQRALSLEELAIHGSSKTDLAGEWTFNTSGKAGLDSSRTGNTIEVAGESSPSKSGVPMHALADLCHVLLNSNEFLYVD